MNLMSTDPDLYILIPGLVRAAIWFYGASVALEFKRGWGIFGFATFGVISLLSSFGNAGTANLSDLTFVGSAVLGTPAAACLVYGYQNMQTRIAMLEAELLVYRKAAERLTETAKP